MPVLCASPFFWIYKRLKHMAKKFTRLVYSVLSWKFNYSKHWTTFCFEFLRGYLEWRWLTSFTVGVPKSQSQSPSSPSHAFVHTALNLLASCFSRCPAALVRCGLGLGLCLVTLCQPYSTQLRPQGQLFAQNLMGFALTTAFACCVLSSCDCPRSHTEMR